ncbi:MAG TPA: molybdopterin cofactor-binding domain-containing protein [Chloroflexota bacterium]|nr:molybdopterin cofactor-binding domain-containing protein [Chloroflexota bacterium]
MSANEQARTAATTSATSTPRRGLSRRTFLKASGILVVGVSVAGPARLLSAPAAHAQQPPPFGDPADLLDSWLAIDGDGAVTVYSGRVELGTGVETALVQIAAEELDVPLDRVTILQGDTARTVDQGASVGSTTVSRGGAEIRRAAAAARQALVGLAAERLGVPADQLTVKDGIVYVASDPWQPNDQAPTRSASYGDLIGGQRFGVAVSDDAQPKDPAQYTIVGRSIPRVDIPAKMVGTYQYVQNVRVPGMLHGRVVRPSPPQSGVTLVSVDEDSVSDVPGLVQVVRQGNWVGVVAEREENAIKAARQLKVTWSDPPGLPPQAEVFTLMRNTPSDDRVLAEVGDVDGALASAARTLQATYEWPQQIHAMMGPDCGVADVRDGRATVWSGTQYPLGHQRLLAQRLGLPIENVRIIYTEGSGCYGRYTTDDAALDAAMLSQAVGRPVRVQWMRQDEHGWDHANTPMLFDMRAGLDASGNVVAWEHQAWSARHTGQALLGDQTGGNWVIPLDPVFVGDDTPKFYDFANRRYVLHALDRAVLRYGNNRSLGAILSAFAAESFIDELAAAAGQDPVQYRLRYLSDPRAIDALRAATERAGWETRPSPKRGAATGGVLTGRGVALTEYGVTPQTGTTWVSAVADVEVDPDSGAVRVPRIVVAHDCGLIVNPDGVRNQIEGNVLQGLSRALFEEATWDSTGVTSIDWRTYPILTFNDVPDVDVVLINRPDVRSSGAGESGCIPLGAVIANAIHDATGVRLRRVPFTAERVKAALAQRG